MSVGEKKRMQNPNKNFAPNRIAYAMGRAWEVEGEEAEVIACRDCGRILYGYDLQRGKFRNELGIAEQLGDGEYVCMRCFDNSW